MGSEGRSAKDWGRCSPQAQCLTTQQPKPPLPTSGLAKGRHFLVPQCDNDVTPPPSTLSWHLVLKTLHQVAKLGRSEI